MMVLEHQLEQIITGCRKGSRKAQEMLYKLFAAKMLGLCMRYAVDKSEAQDMLQNGFVKVFLKLADYRGDGSFEGWMRRIVVHTAIEYYRKHHRIMQLEDIEIADIALETAAVANLETKDLMLMIQQLPDNYRLVFNLHAIEGYSHKEIGQMLQISEGASKVQLSRARSVLKEVIKKTERVRYENFG